MGGATLARNYTPLLPTGFGGKIYIPGNGLGNDLVYCSDVVRCKLLGNAGQQPMSELRWPFYNIITTKEEVAGEFEARQVQLIGGIQK